MRSPVAALARPDQERPATRQQDIIQVIWYFRRVRKIPVFGNDRSGNSHLPELAVPHATEIISMNPASFSGKALPAKTMVIGPGEASDEATRSDYHAPALQPHTDRG